MSGRALVTGDRGLIGRHASAALIRAGYVVTGIDIQAGIDARDYFRHASDRFDLVVHAAAVVGGRAVIDGQPMALAVNFELDAAMFTWAQRTRPGRVVYLSSSAAYPVHLQLCACKLCARARKLCEEQIWLDRPQMPDQLYGWAKLTGEILADKARREGLDVTVARPFSGYAEDQSTDYPFAMLAARARRTEDPFTVWGTGQQVRDFIHVNDIVAAILTMAEDDIDGPLNLGTGRGTSMAELARMMCKAAGYEPEIQPKPEAPQGVAYRVADVTRMREIYKPEVTLEEGVDRVMRQLAVR